MSSMNMSNIHNTALALYQTSTGIFGAPFPLLFFSEFSASG